ncbi:hypothetical protein JAO73_18150 [Hymenobacter sp. BT523]|uniref:hypothetical protein n=1 Tax=Hymenobacter sp. BT523 TaxID=2795725 RepID=UPI0018EE36DA|nr:hypothetical protein [Hymenobacter sp. BT523]MBJ6110950.1 hypothetical protein [Hymenobacter sp. BT523]
MKVRTTVVLLVALVMSAGYYKYHQWHQQEAIRAALEYGRLAPLPDVTTDLQVDTEGSMFSRTFWLCFKADKASIDRWTAQSSTLAKQTPFTVTSADFQSIGTPDWFNLKSITKGVKYVIPSDEEELSGTVWIDYGSGTVYIKTSHS